MPKRKGNTKRTSSSKIEDLPYSDEAPDSNELEVLSSLLDIHETDPQEYNRLRFVFYATALYALLTLPFVDRIIELSSPIANSWLILLIIKTIMFFILFYIVAYSN